MTPPDTGNTPASEAPDEHGPSVAARRRRTVFRRGTLAALAVVAGGAVALTACGGHSGKSSSQHAAATVSSTPSSSASTTASAQATQSREDAQAAKHTSDAKITISPKNGTTEAAVSGAVKVSVTGGKLTKVTMTATSSGHTVAGKISADGKTWQPNAALGHGLQFKISAEAGDAQGRTAAAQATFATKAVSGSFVGYFTPEDGSTVGVGMPVSINFSKAISTSDRADVQRGISVQSSSGQQVVGHWFSSTRLDLRPQTYWQAGSHVTLNLNLAGVEGAPGVYGTQHKTVAFDVGRSQVSTVDAATHMMTVVRDGQVIRTVPISAGGTGHTTYDGQMVIEEKDQTTRMNGATVGFTDDDGKGEYDIPDVPHAMRLSNSGTFIHGNYWSDKSVFGTANTSHGCIGLSDVKGGKDGTTDAAWFYNNSLLGDVVVVKNSPDKTIQPDNGLNGWNMSWSQWVAGSAL
ncbi:Lipoprotein-anchoring transpeptidase ErfK/SrfK [Actinacidiphila yanglinensis]|uniref:Lipoprotein-anchoring transpeptidase ErfK/SrfK n=1 Tax=Actinacidiphila yanglinensis TaxID=310779 RepID=A0A1H5UUQ8_9ACTN|nr:Lipoprotein-anchoring transpeptidase ErfK/SrfK [Actinacidiphila yanglinensis]